MHVVICLKRLEQCLCAKLSELLIGRSDFPVSEELDVHARPRSDYYYFLEKGNYITQMIVVFGLLVYSSAVP